MAGKIVDREETEFGIRTVAFDKDKGFLLNGKPYEIQGTCNHQDHAGVGSALPDALQYFRIDKLKEMGCNAYRTSHNAPTAELLDACDRLGMLVMDENRLLGSDEREHGEVRDSRFCATATIPASVIWSICNEESLQDEPQVATASARRWKQFVKAVSTPPGPSLAAESVGDVYTGLTGTLDVRGWNYHPGRRDG